MNGFRRKGSGIASLPFPFFFFENGGRSPVYRDCYEIEDGTGAARDVHCDVKVTDKAGQAPRPVYLKNE